jgi:hypothetical protein
MTILELKELIRALPDDMMVVVPSGDHDYRKALVHQGDAWKTRGGLWECNEEGQTNTKILIVE